MGLGRLLQAAAAIALLLIALPLLLANPEEGIKQVDAFIDGLPGLLGPLWDGFALWAAESPVCAGAAIIVLAAILAVWRRRK
ncbi:hypothetical protein JW721_00050 [Candidatus Micrarchaeota archaeon]|nr:hypothetical protein [Candidatus Micrarchaeota archaeon]